MTVIPRALRGGSGLLVLLVRVLILLAAFALAAAGLALAIREPPTATERWMCPMHPEVSSATAGQCSICKMALEPVVGPAGARAGKAQKSLVEHPPDCPMHAKPASSAAISDAPPAGAAPAPNPIYGPGVTWLPETFPPPERGKPGDRPVLDTPKRRSFQGQVRAFGWFETPDKLAAVLYRDELVGLLPDQRGTFFRAGDPRVPIVVRLSDEPAEAWDGATSIVRFVVEPSVGARSAGPAAASAPPRAGDAGTIELGHMTRELLAFPENALLRGEGGPYVLVAGDDGVTFTRRPVQIGRIIKGQVVVLAGLREDERIVQSSAFFLDTEKGREPGAGPTAEVGP